MNRAFPKLPNEHPMSHVEDQMCRLPCRQSFYCCRVCFGCVYYTHIQHTTLLFSVTPNPGLHHQEKKQLLCSVLFCYDLFCCFCLHKVMFAFMQPEPGLSHHGWVNAVLICVCTSSWICVVRCRQILCTVYSFFMSVSGYLLTVFSMCLCMFDHVLLVCYSVILMVSDAYTSGAWCLRMCTHKQSSTYSTCREEHKW